MNKKINVKNNKQIEQQQNLDQQQCTTTNNRDLIPIYTEWANHHLLRAKLPPLTDLTGELCLPHKLIPLIYSIIVEFNNTSLEQLISKMSSEEPVKIIENCVDFCRHIGVNIEDIKPRDIRNGHLGAILQFLHQLSEYKRQKRKIVEDKNIHQRRVHFNNQQQQSPKHLSNPSYCSSNSSSKTSSSHIYEQCSSSSGYGSVCHTNISGNSSTVNGSIEKEGLLKNKKNLKETTTDKLNKKRILLSNNNILEEEETKKRSKQKHRVAFKMPPNLLNFRSNNEETNSDNKNNEEKRFGSTPQSSSLRIPQKIPITNRLQNQQIKTDKIIINSPNTTISDREQQFLQNSKNVNNQRIYQKLNQNNNLINKESKIASNFAIKYKNYSTSTQQNCPQPPSFPPPSIQYSSPKNSCQTPNFTKLDQNNTSINKSTQLKIPNNLKSDKNVKEVIVVNNGNGPKNQQNVNSSLFKTNQLNPKEELPSTININNSPSPINNSKIQFKCQQESQQQQHQKPPPPPPLPQKPLLNFPPSPSTSSQPASILCTKSALRMPSKHLIGRNIKNNIVNNVKQEEIEVKGVLTTEKFNEQLQMIK
uniref:Calponin-homology (CH) domain-containing protein n=1 Tax=Meloidogyne enterolobii TaxID=390850 RepID=A0A6V7UC91_MELEN|nr:unnamed protein product [Meloidogyne enterolobii]